MATNASYWALVTGERPSRKAGTSTLRRPSTDDDRRSALPSWAAAIFCALSGLFGKAAWLAACTNAAASSPISTVPPGTGSRNDGSPSVSVASAALPALGEAEAGAAFAVDLFAAAWAQATAVQVRRARVDARSEAGVIGREVSGSARRAGERSAAGGSEG